MRVFALLLLLSISALAQAGSPDSVTRAGQKHTPTPQRSPKNSAVAAASHSAPDEGSLTGERYTSDYFHFRYRLPDKFTVNEDFMEGQQDESKRSFFLLAASGATGAQGAPTVVILADNAAAAGVRDARGYITQVTRGLLQRQGFTPQTAATSLTIAGHRFARTDFTKQDAAQTVLITMLRGYAVNFLLMAPTRAEADSLVNSLQSLEFLSGSSATAKATTPGPAKRPGAKP